MGVLEDQVAQNTNTLQAMADNAKEIQDLTILGVPILGDEKIAIQLSTGETLNTTFNALASFLGYSAIGITDIFASTGIEIDKTDPLNPIIKSTVTGSKVEIGGQFFELVKNPDNNDPLNVTTLEVSDIIKGFDSNLRYIESVYLGGDESLFDDDTVYTQFGGYQLQ
tara:strand:- start:1080 stop:1580 length:501 start_codon:yes stop_codon:yes gene_type:complete